MRNNERIWNNNVLWFRVSIIAVFVWLVIASTVSLILYFTWGQHHQESMSFILEFSVLFFVLPAVSFFGLINSVPLIAQWLSVAIDADDYSEKSEVISEEVNSSYRSMADQLDVEET